MNLHVVFSLDPQLLSLAKTFSLDYAHRLSALELKMSQLSDALAALDLAADRAIERTDADLASLRAQMATLQALVDSQGATPEVLAKIQLIQDKIDQRVDPALPPAPTTGPGTTPAAASHVKPGKHA